MGEEDDLAMRRKRWTKRDALVALASYMARPPRMLLPPAPEVERVASLTGHDAAAVRASMRRFACADPDNATTGDAPTKTEQRLWDTYRDDFFRLQADAEDAVEEANGRRKRFLDRLRR